MSIKANTKSDELTNLRKIFCEDGLFAQFGQLFQINLILDANAVLADLRWLVCKAKKPSARTKLLESIDSETIVAYAPRYLHVEVQKNIPKIAEEEGIDPSMLFEHWERYQSKIKFIESGGPIEGQIDPKDAPYVKLHDVTGFPVLTDDTHISKMGAKVVDFQVTALAQSYGRDAVVEYKIKAGFIGTFTITRTMVEAASSIVRSFARHISHVPTWAWLLVLLAFAYAISLQAVQNWLKQKIAALPNYSKSIAINLYAMLEPIVMEYHQSQIRARKAKQELIRKVGI